MFNLFEAANHQHPGIDHSPLLSAKPLTAGAGFSSLSIKGWGRFLAVVAFAVLSVLLLSMHITSMVCGFVQRPNECILRCNLLHYNRITTDTSIAIE